MSDKKLDQMKEDYETMKIPPQLKGLVLESIERAKAEEKEVMSVKKETHKTKRSKMYLIIKRTVQVAAGLLLAITVAANSNATIANAMEKIPVIGAITKVVTFRNYEVNNGNTQANIKTPQIEVTEESAGISKDTVDEINKSVEEYTNQLIEQFEKDVKEFEAIQTEEGGPYEAVDSEYEVIADTDTLFSLRINTTISQGGSINLSKIYHIDKRTDKVIRLRDIFVDKSDYIKVLSESVKKKMRTNMNEDENLSYFIDSEEGMNEHDFKEIKEDQNFYISKVGNLTLVFDEYEVAPGYMNIVEIEIPSEEISLIIKEGYVK